jgi:hypothetical protein
MAVSEQARLAPGEDAAALVSRGVSIIYAPPVAIGDRRSRSPGSRGKRGFF